MEELKPCPFCGGKASLGNSGIEKCRNGDLITNWYVWCPNCGINQEIGCPAYKDKTKWAEKKIGKWVKNHQNDNIVYCDQCYMPQDMPTLFCHSCGAKMDGGAK